MQRIKLDIYDNQAYEQLYIKQYNKGFSLEFEITQNGEPFDLSGYTALFEMKKPDKTVIWQTCDITDNIISIEVTDQMTIADGKAEIQITLTKGDVSISTVTGTMKIDKSTIQDGDIESSSEISLVTNVLVQVGEAKQAAIDSQTYSEQAKTYSEQAKSYSDDVKNALSSKADLDANGQVKSEQLPSNLAYTSDLLLVLSFVGSIENGLCQIEIENLNYICGIVGFECDNPNAKPYSMYVENNGSNKTSYAILKFDESINGDKITVNVLCN